MNNHQNGDRMSVKSENLDETTCNSSGFDLLIDRNENRKLSTASSGNGKILSDPPRPLNSNSKDKLRVEVIKTNKNYKQMKTINRKRQYKLKNEKNRHELADAATNPQLHYNKNTDNFKTRGLPHIPGRDGKQKPIILSADSSELTIDALDLMKSKAAYQLRPKLNNEANTNVKPKQNSREGGRENAQKIFKLKETKIGTEKENDFEIQTRKSVKESKTAKNSNENSTDLKFIQKLSSNNGDKNGRLQSSPSAESVAGSLNVKGRQLRSLHSSPIGASKPSDIVIKTNKETIKMGESHKKSIKFSEVRDNKLSRLHIEKSKGIKKPQKAKKGTGDKEDGAADDKNNFKAVYQKTFTPKKIFDGGRRIPPIELLPQKKTTSSVRVFLFDDFLSERECEGLMKAHDNHVQAMSNTPLMCFDDIVTLRRHLKDIGKNIKVNPKVFTYGTKCLNASFSLEIQTLMKSNWSYSTAFYPGESAFSKVAASRIQRAMGLNPENGGKFQITSYPTGKAYNIHTDCTLNGFDERDRVVSVLMYLNTVEDGGETKFPELGIWVKPRKGRAIIWNNMSPNGFCEPHSQHVASVVKTGSKYILIRWYYYKNFYFLGRRPNPPELPTRDENVPMVMCDEYNMGSCRWYDEWSYDALLAYKRQKATGFV